MKTDKIRQLIKTAKSLDWAIKVKTNMNTSLILNPRFSNLNIVSVDGCDYIELERSMLDIDSITHAYLYSNEKEGDL